LPRWGKGYARWCLFATNILPLWGKGRLGLWMCYNIGFKKLDGKNTWNSYRAWR
jgi:hypothetical protein